MQINLTYKMAHAAAWDEGNRSAKQAGHTEWNEEDWNAACRKFEEIMPLDTYMKYRKRLV